MVKSLAPALLSSGLCRIMLSSPHSNPGQTIIERKVVRQSLLLYILPILLAAGCATKPAVNEGPKSAFTQNTVALMIMPTYEDAEVRRLSLVRGKPIPPSAEIIPIPQLDGISTVLSKAASGLRECGVSRVIPPAETNIGNAYIVLQRGSTVGGSCELTDKESQTFFEKVDEIGGTALIGLLAIGLTVLLVALPFIL
jgi:hypothetical protein